MKQSKKPIKKSRQVAKPSLLKRFTKLRLAIIAGIILAAGAGLVLLLPDSASLSLASITGKSTDRVAPKLDTLSGNYSVAGEAASTSLLVKYKKAVSANTRATIHKQLGATTKRHIGPLDVDVVQVDSADSVGETIQKYKAHGEVEYVEPNYLAKHFLTPNDNLFSKQWQLQKIGAPQAWDSSQGGFGPIAIVDTGIMASQTDLSGHVLPGYNFVSGNTDTTDDNGHGTHVAGIVSAATNNGTGVSSIGFQGSLLPVKVLDNTGAGTYGDVASGIIYAADNGARIINVSLGGPSSSRTMQDAVKYAASKGAIIVAAAGNNANNSPVYPAAYPGVIAVSASDQNDSLASFSSYGSDIYVSAPGVNIISTYSSGGYATMSGTSMAAPLVSGLIGLALSKGSTTVSTILGDLRSTSDKVGPYGYDQNGWNQYFGYGRVNAAKLLGTAAVGDTVTPTITESKPTTQKLTGAAASGGAAKVQFDTTLEGTVDSISPDGSKLTIKVKTSGNNLQLRADNLIDLFITTDTVIKSGSNNITVGDLKTGDNLNIKARWQDNRLTGLEAQLLGRPVKASSNKTRR